MKDYHQYDLIIFDMDGTLSDWKTGELLPNVKEWFDAQSPNRKFALASNQGGVGLRYWMELEDYGEPEKFPVAKEIREHVQKVLSEVGKPFVVVNWCYAYQNRKRKWSPVPPQAQDDPKWDKHCRKPNPGMLLDAIEKTQVSLENVLMVGDRSEDEKAAERAGCDFIHADKFFDRT